ncbi:hypothetical protein Ccur_11610 [Cryptobacterium curtum DSM 15641]|uniref:Uncharacterized protein n=1 Tax=Cryptobacterium curtum (strain ATCC 700683 / DSM 15641 / CCUG 43107 / 12-3) TaxID=469378 RepID=C7MPK8_CRYCD|nr:hypothetical protein [Cryptobacterium curtum]ACU94848.1 hypothetical protein Ccur_11610 [Cryptobacterium curtum DSM 15641]
MSNQNHNPYAYSRALMTRELDDHLSGSLESLFLVVSTQEISAIAHDALQKTADALGYGNNGATFLTLPASPNEETPSQTNQTDHQNVQRIIEGLDPLCLIATDVRAANSIGAAYDTNVSSQTKAISYSGRIAGRETRVFDDFNTLVTTEAGKQHAWALLKTLPTFSGIENSAKR